MKNLIAIILALLFILALNDIANGQDCLPKLIKASKDTTFTVTDSNLLLIERPDNSAYEVTMTFRKKVIAPVVTTVNNTELTFTGLWEHPSGTWGTISHSSTVGATAKYSFTGKRIEVFGTKASHHGLLGYTINGGLEKSVNLNSVDRQDGVLLIDEDVPAGFNTITLRCISATVLIDYLRIQN